MARVFAPEYCTRIVGRAPLTMATVLLWSASKEVLVGARKRQITIAVLALITIGLDQASKIWAQKALRGQPRMNVIDGFFQLSYHENPGVVFGLGRDLPAGRYILIALGIVVLFLVWRVVAQIKTHEKIAAIAMGLVAGGAIGNIIDRIYIGRVVDFVVMHWRDSFYWPAYNIADVALVVGVGLLIIAMGGKPKGAAESAR